MRVFIKRKFLLRDKNSKLPFHNKSSAVIHKINLFYLHSTRRPVFHNQKLISGEYEVKVIEKCTFLDPRHEKIRVNRSIVNIERVQELIIGGAEEFFGYKSPKIILKLMEK
ncbi:unnamed protein product [Rhizophagus irregularis]|uniref:Uncharacterized protein n=1 Tax=Rhizophagus irregularis TaxID=588596 RepID=A0A915ZHC1_9GLOM|nr:unnamed protein product [Rhizophagus irregularis]CAB5377257.1 unnamed protein product [Rhizophagus irregularis]